MDPLSPAPAAPSSRSRFTLGIIVGVVVVIAVIGFGAWWWTQGVTLANGTVIEFSEAGSAAWYRVEGHALAQIAGLASYNRAPVSVLAVASSSAPGDAAVLARVPSQRGTVVGILHTDMSFTPVVADGTNKEGIAARPDGFAVFSSHTSVGAGPEWRLVLVDLQRPQKAPVDLGAGRSPRFLANGLVIALAPEGVVRIDPMTGARAVVVGSQGAEGAGGALSADGSVAALPNAKTGAIDFYSIQSAEPPVTPALGTLPLIPEGGAFVGNAYYAARTAAAVAIYRLPAAGAKAAAAESLTISK